ncbi:MAG TPA: YciI family protein [Candidatus Limnocylindria bacterium]|nr:YciI family protein [Candidatus Limnocylindria bacterium]
MSKYAFLFLDDGVDYQSDPTPEQQRVYADIFKWFEVNGPKIVDGGAELQPTRTATTIRKTTGEVTVVDGPFIESKESVGGFSIIEVPDREAAIALAKTWPGYGIEIRDVVEQRERAEV